MTGIDLIPLLFVILIIIATIGLGFWTTRRSKTASDFFVASRSVGVGMNASAISGEYLSAASFMGVAGLIMRYGYDTLWYPVCYAAGYLFLLLFIAGPLRRFGAYTIPDFAEGRFDSPLFRKIAVMFVLFIGFFYTMPQMKGAGLVMGEIMGWPYWVGIVVVGAVITFNVAVGGMKGITFVQAFQYWVKMFAISVPVFVLMAVFGGYGDRMENNVENPTGRPMFQETVTQTIKGTSGAPANVLNVVAPSTFAIGGTPNFSINQQGLLVPSTRGTTDTLTVPPAEAMVQHGTVIVANNPIQPGRAVAVNIRDGDAKVTFAEAAPVTFMGSSNVPNAPDNQKWVRPYGDFTSRQGYPLLYTYSLIMALVCGTAGLPHILVRFYTNPDGRAAKRTTFWVMVLIGVFYMFTPIWGTLGRAIVPELYANNRTDAVVINLPRALDSELLGAILSGITSAGAFAAFMSTFSGLLVSMSGAVAHDIYGRILRPSSSPESRLTAFKFASIGIGAVSIVLGLLVEQFDIAKMVGWAFAIGAASYFPLLLMGSWWRGLTMLGAATGMLVGGFASVGTIVAVMVIDKTGRSGVVPPLARVLMEQPAIWAVPLSLTLMYVVSKMTAGKVPADVDMKMLRLHAPEEMGISKNYIEH
jgi:cation/acetate symporter